jgi:FixJ family two-component response regulator/glycine cleavage system H lipoate-binding protein
MENQISLLVVDDEQIVLDSIAKHLRHEKDLSLSKALSVEEALGIMDEKKVQIILTDLMMPDIDGLEFLSMMMKKDEDILVIMITGYATINTALQAMQLGAFDYLSKPFTRDELKKVVQRAADLVNASQKTKTEEEKKTGDYGKISGNIKGIGEHSWFMRQEDGAVLIGVERPLLYTLGKIQTVYMPAIGDKLRQGSVYFQIFSTDLRSQSLLCPLSGDVIEINQNVVDNPNKALEDPYGDGWLIKIEPENFSEEVKLLGL